MVKQTNHAPLSGEALQNFLDAAYEQIFTSSQPDEDVVSTLSDTERSEALAELLSQQQFAPQDLQELDLVHTAWTNAKRHEEALAALEEHKPHVFSQLTTDQHTFANTLCSLNTVYSLKELDLEKARESLVDLTPLMLQLNSDELRSLFKYWLNLIDSCQVHEAIEPQLEGIYRNLHADQDDDFYSQIQYLLKKAEWASQQDDETSAEQHTQSAIEQLARLGSDNAYPDFSDWLALAYQVLHIAPQNMSLLIDTCNAQLAQTEKPTASPAVQQYRRVYLRRLLALSHAAQNEMEAAISLGRESCYLLGLTDDDDHLTNDYAFTARWMHWLEDNNQLEELADFALEQAFHCRGPALHAAYEIALRHVEDDSAQQDQWALILAWCDMSAEAKDLIGDTPEPYTYYLEKLTKNHGYASLIALMEGSCLAYSKTDSKQALALLEQGLSDYPHLSNGDIVCQLWGARLEAYGDEALNMPYPPCLGANWSYTVGAIFSNQDELLPYLWNPETLPSKEQRELISEHYYKNSFMRYENFWTNGQGAMTDAYLHTYSMLCNNLGILLRYTFGRPAEAFELHQKGLSSSPFAEHVHGILSCKIDQNDNEGIAHMSEQLWQYVLDHGYSRHDPRDYIHSTCIALHELDRTDEIAIWIERLEQWWQTAIERESIDINDPEELSDYYYCVIPMLDLYGRSQPDNALFHLREHRPGIRSTCNAGLLRNLGTAFILLESHEEAIPLMEEAIANIDEHTDEYDIEYAHKELANSREVLGLTPTTSENTGKKPWWKIW